MAPGQLIDLQGRIAALTGRMDHLEKSASQTVAVVKAVLPLAIAGAAGANLALVEIRSIVESSGQDTGNLDTILGSIKRAFDGITTSLQGLNSDGD